MNLQVARRRIASFQKRFGDAHFCLACHAAFPLSLTPDLLYRLWANFQRDSEGNALNVPWVAVADILLSVLCREVGNELYEMDGAVRSVFIEHLKTEKRFGTKRIKELSEFLLAYMQQHLHSNDPDVQDFASTQRWTALSYMHPGKATNELALALSNHVYDTPEMLRLISICETLAEPLADFSLLQVFSRAMKSFAYGDLAGAANQLSDAVRSGRTIKIGDTYIPLPDSLPLNEPPASKTFKIVLAFINAQSDAERSEIFETYKQELQNNGVDEVFADLLEHYHDDTDAVQSLLEYRDILEHYRRVLSPTRTQTDEKRNQIIEPHQKDLRRGDYAGGIRRSIYLHERGFAEDPFAPRRAREGSEEDLLSSVFWMIPGIDAFIGDPAIPQTRILYAPRGYGKTSHMLQVKKHVSKSSPRALVIELTDFNYMLQEGVEQVSVHRYIELIRKAVLEELNHQIMTDQQCLQTFEQSFTFRDFCTWLTRYSPDTAEQSRCLVRQQEVANLEQETSTYGPEAWLKSMAKFAQEAGFASVYVLVDGLDETELTSHETPEALETMSTMLNPLLVAQRLMHGCGFAFKFFIPKLLYEYMLTHNKGHLDCYRCFELQWSSAALEEILNLRVSYCSNGWVVTFQELCDDECEPVVKELIRAAKGPYRMIAWLDMVVDRHCQKARDVDKPIEVETIREVLQQVYNPRLTGVVLTSSTSNEEGEILTEYTFRAVITSPLSNPGTITYIWQVDGKEVMQKQSNRLSDTLTWQWDMPGKATVSVVAKNAQGSVTSRVTLTLHAPANVLWCDANRVFYVGTKKLDISGKPYKVLGFLYDKAEQYVSLQKLSRDIHQRNPDPHDVKSLQRCKSRLSSVLEQEYVFIHSERRGYRLSRKGTIRDTKDISR